MKISILHPSFKRAAIAYDCYRKWTTSMDNLADAEYILSLSEGDPQLDRYKKLLEGQPAVKITIGVSKGWVKALNDAALQSTGNLLVCIGDDFSCPRSWDTQLLQALEGKEDYIVKTQDGTQPWIMTLPIMDRAYYNRFGYVVYPGYTHMFGDTELTHVADLIGRVINLPIVFPHDHYTTGRSKKDEVNTVNDATWSQGETLYISRMKENFGIENPLPITLPSHHVGWLKTKGVQL